MLKNDDDNEAVGKREKIKEENYKFINKWKNKTDYLENPAVLKEALDEYEKLNRFYGVSGNEGFYFHLRTAQDQNNPKLKAKFNSTENFELKISNDIQFFEHNIARISNEKQNLFLNFDGLKNYKHFLERLFVRAKYLLSDSEEKILNLKQSSAYSNWIKMTSGFLAKEERTILNEKGKRETKSFSDIFSLASNQKNKIRGMAAEAFNDILAKNVDVAEAEMNSILSDKKTNDELRKMPRPDLARHIDDDIDSSTVDALVLAVSSRFGISRKYYALKAKLMRLKKLEYHERNVEYGKIGQKFSYQEAINIVYKTFLNLDDKFAGILQSFVSKNQIDVYPKKGKDSGAFCSSNLISQPTFVLLNFSGRFNDIKTIAHEFGHAINSELQKESQNSLNVGTPKSTAETASTFVEDFVLEEVGKEADEELRLTLMMSKLNDDVSTIFRQVACYMFEQELHSLFRQKGYLSKEEIGKLFQKHMRAYMGPAVIQSPGSQNWWVYWGHIRNFFYNYSYASGLLISKTMQNYYARDKAFMSKIKEFLSAGTSDSPKNLFKKMGIDITGKKFWNDGLDTVENLLKETEKLAKRLGKI